MERRIQRVTNHPGWGAELEPLLPCRGGWRILHGKDPWFLRPSSCLA